MKCPKIILMSLFFAIVCALPPFFVPVAIGVGASAVTYFSGASCYFKECCNSQWISFNKAEFAAALDRQLYGQPYADSAVAAVADHFASEAPKKALVLSLHGPAGTGKNYFAEILKRRVFRRADTEFFRLFSATVHFQHRAEADTYKTEIQQNISSAVARCPRSVFVFDEVEKMPQKLLDSLRTFVDFHDSVDGVDFRRATFIFLSNDGADLITRRMVQVMRDGRNRHSIPRSEFDHLLSQHLFTTGTLAHSNLLANHLVSRFVPFLPLERNHVRECIRDEMKRLRLSADGNKAEQRIENVLKEIPFVPSQEKFFSSVGCKRVADKLRMVLEDERL